MSLWTGNKTNLKNLEVEKMTNDWIWDFKGIFILYIDDSLNINTIYSGWKWVKHDGGSNGIRN